MLTVHRVVICSLRCAKVECLNAWHPLWLAHVPEKWSFGWNVVAEWNIWWLLIVGDVLCMHDVWCLNGIHTYIHLYRTEESNILRSCDFICAKYLIRKFSYFCLSPSHLNAWIMATNFEHIGKKMKIATFRERRRERERERVEKKTHAATTTRKHEKFPISRWICFPFFAISYSHLHLQITFRFGKDTNALTYRWCWPNDAKAPSRTLTHFCHTDCLALWSKVLEVSRRKQIN